MMGKEKIAITLDEEFIGELDRLVKRHVFQNRSQAIREAVSKKLLRLKRSRLTIECAKLDRVAEKAMAEEGMTEEDYLKSRAKRAKKSDFRKIFDHVPKRKPIFGDEL